MDFLWFFFCVWFMYWLGRLLKFCCYMFKCHILTSFYRQDLKKFGEWAIITGATDGIGKCYAKELAKLKFNILLISRTESKLQRVADEIKNTYGVKTQYIVFDFSNADGYDEMKKILQPLDVGILVNNVGMSSQWDRLYDELDVTEHLKVMHTNTFGEIQLTHMLTRKMMKQKRGVIVHISSFFGYFSSLGLISVYAPTKAFVNAFVENLQAETESCKDVHHQLVTPFFVVTNMTDQVVQPSKVTPDAATFVSSAVLTIGITSQTFGYWTHDLIGSFLLTFPTSVFKCLPFCKSFKRNCKVRRKKILEKSD